MSAAARPAKRVRPKRRTVTFVRPQLMHHEALALIDYMRGSLVDAPENAETFTVRAALDEVVRATNEYKP